MLKMGFDWFFKRWIDYLRVALGKNNLSYKNEKPPTTPVLQKLGPEPNAFFQPLIFSPFIQNATMQQVVQMYIFSDEEHYMFLCYTQVKYGSLLFCNTYSAFAGNTSAWQ